MISVRAQCDSRQRRHARNAPIISSPASFHNECLNVAESMRTEMRRCLCNEA